MYSAAMNARRQVVLLHALFVLSGVAGLGYQFIWTGQFAVGLGHEIPSLLSVVGAFFGGLALGAWARDRRITASRVPGRWYAVLEIVIGVWGAASVLLIDRANVGIATLIGVDASPARQWGISFLVPLLVLLPATTAMGATLPAMDRLVARLGLGARRVGGLYSANTTGALIGVLVSVFVLIPALGFRVAGLMFAGINLLCAVIVLWGPARGESERAPAHEPVTGVSKPRVLISLFVTGLLGIGYEVMAVRVMAQVLENTVYSYASALSVYLLGTALGAALWQRFLAHRDFQRTLSALVQVLAVTCFIGILLLLRSADLYAWGLRAFGGTLVRGVLAESLLATAAFALPAIIMGATFSHLVQAARESTRGVGRALAVNTLGGAVAPFLFGILLLPLMGAKLILMMIAASYVALVPRFTPARLLPSAVALLLGIGTFFGPDLRLVDPMPGGEVIEYREGVLAAVAVVTDGQEERYLKVNNHFTMGSTLAGFAERREAHVPLLLHPNPRRALLLGIGTGNTLRAAASHPGLEVDAVELLPEIIEFGVMFDPAEAPLESRDGLGVHGGDARRFVRATDRTYDVIIADLFQPARDGSGWLYTKEHFEIVGSRLNDGGLFCQWLPLYQLDHDMLRTIVRTFLAVYPDARAYLGYFNVETPMLGLIGGDSLPRHGAGWLSGRPNAALVRDRLIEQQQALYDDIALLACFAMDRAALAAYAGEGPLNTDDRTIVRHGAPRFMYTGGSSTYGRLIDLIEDHGGDPASALAANDPAFVDRVRAAITARDDFLRARVEHDAGRLLQACNLYASAAEASADLNASYLILVNLCGELARTDGDRAKWYLERMIEARPDRPEAVRLRRQLGR
jgi:spermidine synthase